MIGRAAYLDVWHSVESDDLSAVAFAKEEGVPLAVANRVFGKDALKPIIEELKGDQSTEVAQFESGSSRVAIFEREGNWAC